MDAFSPSMGGPAVDPDVLFLADSFRYTAAAQIRKHAKAMKKLLKRGGEDEVHEARTQSRRLLELVALASSFTPPFLCRPVMDDLRELLPCLSSLRNQDIFILFLEKTAAGFPKPEDRDLFEKFLKVANKRREKLRGETFDLWPKERIKKTLRNIRKLDEWTEARLSRVPSQRLAESFQHVKRSRGQAFSHQIGRISLEKPGSLHPLRKSARELRYALELQAEIIPNPASSRLLAFLKTWQRVLGDVHDGVVRTKKLARTYEEFADRYSRTPHTQALFRKIEGLNARQGRAALAQFKRLRRRISPAFLARTK